MSTENMPTTNQNPDGPSLGDKIPPTVAEGFVQGSQKLFNYASNKSKEAGQGR